MSFRDDLKELSSLKFKVNELLRQITPIMQQKEQELRRQMEIDLQRKMNEYLKQIDKGKEFIKLSEKYKKLYLKIFGVVPNAQLTPELIYVLFEKFKKML